MKTSLWVAPVSGASSGDNSSASSDPHKHSAREAEKVMLFPTSSMKKPKSREVEKFKDTQLKKKNGRARLQTQGFRLHSPDQLTVPQADSRVWT